MNVNTWKVSMNGEVVAQVLSCMNGVERPRVVSRTIGGYVHVQSTGHPMDCADLSLFSTRAEKARFDTLEAAGYEVSFVYRNVRYFGYFEQAVSWNPIIPGEYYAAQGKLLITRQEIVEETFDPGESAVLGTAVLGRMILGKDVV